MKVSVIGRGHFAGIVAVSLDRLGHAVRQEDEMPPLLRDCQRRAEDETNFRPYKPATFDAPEIVWVAYDAPLNAQGQPITREIEDRIWRLHSRTSSTVPFVVSCQWPVGTMRRVSENCQDREFIYVLENVRVGKALSDFAERPLSVVGANVPLSTIATQLLSNLDPTFALMSWESAELTKHTINAFMALQIAFINEIAQLAEAVGASSRDVARGLKHDSRVDPRAPLTPGGPFSGGSLQRDLEVIATLQEQYHLDLGILNAILPSNRAQRKAAVCSV